MSDSLDALVNEAMDEIVSVGGKDYTFKIEVQCKICRDSTHLTMINTMLTNGMTYKYILRALEPINAVMEDPADKISYHSIRNHAKKHFGFDRQALNVYRQIVERRAQEQGENFVEGVASALTPMALFDGIMNKGWQDMQKTRAEDVSPETAIRAAKELQAITDKIDDNTQLDQMRIEFNQVIEAVKRHVDPSQWQAIVDDLAGKKDETVDADKEIST